MRHSLVDLITAIVKEAPPAWDEFTFTVGSQDYTIDLISLRQFIDSNLVTTIETAATDIERARCAAITRMDMLSLQHRTSINPSPTDGPTTWVRRMIRAAIEDGR